MSAKPKTKLKHDQLVSTPKGRGRITGSAVGGVAIVVILKIPGEVDARCWTPNGKVESTWVFHKNDIAAIDNG